MESRCVPKHWVDSSIASHRFKTTRGSPRVLLHYQASSKQSQVHFIRRCRFPSCGTHRFHHDNADTRQDERQVLVYCQHQRANLWNTSQAPNSIEKERLHQHESQVLAPKWYQPSHPSQWQLNRHCWVESPWWSERNPGICMPTKREQLRSRKGLRASLDRQKWLDLPHSAYTRAWFHQFE